MKRLTCTSLVLLTCLGLMCGGGTGPVANTPPVLPNAASLTIPTFENAGTPKSGRVAAGSNYTGAVNEVLYWTTTVQGAFAVPGALYSAASVVEPVELLDKTGWQWTVASGVNTGILTASVSDSAIGWTLSATSGTMVGANWMTGTSNVAGDSGSWAVYNPVTADTVLHAITYDITSVNDVFSFKIMNVRTINPATAPSLTCDAAGDSRTITLWGEPGYDYITWAVSTGAGTMTTKVLSVDRITCWGPRTSNYPNTTCP